MSLGSAVWKLPVLASTGVGTFVLAAQEGDAGTAAVLLGVIGSITALLGWVIRRQQIANEKREQAHLEQRAIDRAKDREERQALLAAHREELRKDRDAHTSAITSSGREITRELKAMRIDLSEGKGCRYFPPNHHATESPTKPSGTRGL